MNCLNMPIHISYEQNLCCLYNSNHFEKTTIQRGPDLRAFRDLKKNVLHEIRVSGTLLWSPTNAKSPHLHVHKPKTVLVETMLVIFCVSVGPPVVTTVTLELLLFVINCYMF